MKLSPQGTQEYNRIASYFSEHEYYPIAVYNGTPTVLWVPDEKYQMSLGAIKCQQIEIQGRFVHFLDRSNRFARKSKKQDKEIIALKAKQTKVKIHSFLCQTRFAARFRRRDGVFV